MKRNSLSQAVQSSLKLNCYHDYWVAYSGGVDSHVLLHVLSCLRSQYPFQLHAIHVNHQLHGNSMQWASHCEQVCRALEVPIMIKNIEVITAFGESVEAIARAMRYKIFSETLPTDAALLTAHHQDDQAETVLLQLLRGAGVAGLSAMPERKPFAKRGLLRPLLICSRDEIVQYAETQSLEWIEDSSNTDININRNYLRHEILPLLQKRFPGMKTTLSRSAKHCASACHLLNEIAEQDYQKMSVRCHDALTLPINALTEISLTRRINVIRYWLMQNNVRMPNEKKLNAILKNVIPAREDANPSVSWDQVEVRRYQHHLYIVHKDNFDPKIIIPWDGKNDCQLPTGEIISKHCLKKILGLLGEEKLSIRYRQGGEQLKTTTHHHALKKWFQENRIPPWQRDRIPLLFVDDELVFVLQKNNKDFK